MCFSSWHSFCLFSMLNYMSDQLQCQRYQQVDLQMKLMDMLSAHGIGIQYSSFVVSVISSGDLMRGKRREKDKKLLRAFDLGNLVNRRKSRCRQYLAQWRAKACGHSNLISTLERKLQLTKFVQKLDAHMRTRCATSWEDVRHEADIRKRKVNMSEILINVSACSLITLEFCLCLQQTHESQPQQGTGKNPICRIPQFLRSLCGKPISFSKKYSRSAYL